MKAIFLFFGLLLSTVLFSQETYTNLLSTAGDDSKWKLHNREVLFAWSEPDKIESITFNAIEGDGLAIYQDLEFENGEIEFDIKGKNVPGKSFVGIAFHIQDEETFNAVYFRPFNFNNPDKVRNGHSVQYICHPNFPWHVLRKNFPEQFENPIQSAPNPDDWFHAKVVVTWPNVKVYVENQSKPSLNVKMKSTFKKGKIGFWAGNGSDGSYKNLSVKTYK